MLPHATIFFAGGGTGGHIFPALAIAEAIAQHALPTGHARAPRCEFLCSSRPLDSAILTAQRIAGEPANFHPLPAQPMILRPVRFAKFLASWAPSVRVARSLLRDARRRGPVLMVATGGFVAAPAAQAAHVERVPIILVNLDAVPGKANNWIARRATRVVSAAPTDRTDWEHIPPIVRSAALPHASPESCRTSLGLDPGVCTLFVTGGSQGAGSVNDFLLAFARAHADALRGWQVVHQAGESADRVRKEYARIHITARVEAFFDLVGACWGAADCAVSRSGAGGVAEAWASATPTLFLPYPYHADHHQRKNTARLVDAGGAVVRDDQIDATKNLATSGPDLLDLLTNEQRRGAMRSSLRGLGPVDGAQRVARAITGLLEAMSGSH